MNRMVKTILGFLSIVPLTSLILLLVQTARALVGIPGMEDQEHHFWAFLRPYGQFMWLGLGTAVLLVLVFLIITMRDNNTNEAEKSRWIVLLILLNYVAFPVFWYQRIWRHEVDLSSPTDRLN